MEDNFRNVLIILSAVIIAAIFIHGFWTIRKNKNPYKLKAKVAKGEKFESAERGFDGAGFDQDGIGRVRVVGETVLNQNEIPQEAAPAPTYDEEPLPQDIEKRSHNKPTLEPTLGDLSDITGTPPQNTPPPAQMHTESSNVEEISLSTASMQRDNVSTHSVLDEKVQDHVQAAKPVYQAPVSQPKQTTIRNEEPKKRSERKAAIKRNQMEINFGDELPVEPNNEPVPSVSTTDNADLNAQRKANVEITPEVIVVSVVMNEDNTISGAALLPALLTLGLRYGDMDIFHRHQDNAGNGKVTFSLANMMNPGTFNLDEIESFTTQGISLFMTLPNAGDPFEVFEQMMSAAKQLAMEFNGQLLDDKRSVMTKQTEQHYTSKIREFERKSRIAQA